MSGNERDGSYRTTKANMMRAYDKLPRSVRHALANAVFDYVPQPLLTRWRRDGWKAETLVKLIAGWDRRELARESRRNGRRK